MTGRERKKRGSRALGGTPERAYWAKVHEQCHGQVRAYFARNVRCPHDVEDLVQEVFANLIEHGASLDAPETYVRAVMCHQLCAYWRRRKRADLAVERMEKARSNRRDVEELSCAGGGNPLAQLAETEMQHKLVSMIGELSPGYAEVLRLRFIKGLRLDEAAAQAGCSREAMKKRLSRAKRSLERLYVEDLRSHRIARRDHAPRAVQAGN